MFSTIRLQTLCGLFVLVLLPYFGFADNDDPLVPTEEMCVNAPFIDCPAFVWLKPSESIHPNRTGFPVVSPGGPGCDTPVVSFEDEVFIINSCHRIYTRIWRAVDPNDASLVDTCHQTIKVVDEEPPAFTVQLDDLTVYASGSDLTTGAVCRSRITWTPPTASDNHLVSSISFTVSRDGQQLDLVNGDLFTQGLYTIEYTALDFCGNFVTQSFTIDVMCADCHLTCPDDVIVSPGSDVSPGALGTATAFTGNTNCGSAEINFTDKPVETACPGTERITRIWTGRFANMPGNITSCDQTITLQDPNMLAIHNCPSDLIVANNNTIAHWAEPILTSSINSNPLALTSNFSPGRTFPVGITLIQYTGTDGCDNEVNCSFRVSVLEDSTFSDCPTDIDLSCDATGTVVADWVPPVHPGGCSDCADGPSLPGFIYVGSFNGSHYYCSRDFFTYEDALAKAAQAGGKLASINSEAENKFVSSNIYTATAFIGLSDAADEGDFVWEDGSDLSFTSWFPMQPNNFENQDHVEIMRSGLWNDVELGKRLEFVMEIPCSFVTQISGPAPGSRLGTGTHVVRYKIYDGCGLDAYCEFTINVRNGLAANCPSDIFVRAPDGEDFMPVDWMAPTGFSCCSDCDDSSGCVSVVQTEGPPPGTEFFKQSRTDITYQIKDVCDNTITCRFQVIVDITTDLDGLMVTREEKASAAQPLMIPELPQSNKATLETRERPAPVLSTPEISQTEARPSEDLIYPNPVSDVLTLRLGDNASVRYIMLMTSDGKQILQLAPDGSTDEFNMNMAHLPPGLYFLSIMRAKDNTVLRVIKN